MALYNSFRSNLGVSNKYKRHHKNGKKIMNELVDSDTKNH